jgi:hypothetical protein
VSSYRRSLDERSDGYRRGDDLLLLSARRPVAQLPTSDLYYTISALGASAGSKNPRAWARAVVDLAGAVRQKSWPQGTPGLAQVPGTSVEGELSGTWAKPPLLPIWLPETLSARVRIDDCLVG